MAIATFLVFLMVGITLITDGFLGMYSGFSYRKERKKEEYIQTLKRIMKDMQDDYDAGGYDRT